MKRSATVAGLAMAGTALSRTRVLGANERLRIGLIGCGSRGYQSLIRQELLPHRDAYNVEVTAVCDVWRPARETAAAGIAEAQGHRPETFARYGDLLASDLVDGVIIATPDFAHCPILIDAAKAGIDAYCEKPMASRFEDAKGAVEAVRANRTICQIGTQRRSDGAFRGGAELLRSGALGQVTQITSEYHDNGPRWRRGFDDVREDDVDWEQYQMGLPPRPFDPRRYRCWHLYQDYTSGVSGLWGAHMFDVALWYMDATTPLWGTGEGGTFIWKDREICDTFESNLVYPGGFMLGFAMRLGNSTRGPEVVFYGTRGAYDTSSRSIQPSGGGDPVPEPIVAEVLPSEPHLKNWLDCMRSRQEPNAPVEAGFNHSVAAILVSESQQRGRRLYYDDQAGAIVENNPRA